MSYVVNVGTGTGQVRAIPGSIPVGGYAGETQYIDPTFHAARISERFLDPNAGGGTGGVYRIAMKSGALTGVSGSTPNSDVFAFQWTSTTYTAVITRFRFHWVTTTAFGTAQNVDFGVFFARSFTVADSGGTAATLTTNNAKKRTSYPTTKVASIRMCTTGALTAGTYTADAQALTAEGFGSTGLALGKTASVVTDDDMCTHSPFAILAANEGLVMQNLTNMGATGVIALYVEVNWYEVINGVI